MIGGVEPSMKARYIECYGDPGDGGFEAEKSL
jgi:hypothetical protein